MTATLTRSTVDANDFAELVIQPSGPRPANPFTDMRITGSFAREGDGPTHVGGFVDSPDGSVLKTRFLARQPGRYRYNVTCQSADGDSERFEGSFDAQPSQRKGLLRLDPDHPNHFIWEGTGEHYFWNGTTAYFLAGFRDEAVIARAIDRLASLKVNRIRTLLYGRNGDRPWGEPVVNHDAYSLRLNPWQAKFPDDEVPEFDLTRFNVAYWQKFERLLMHARERDVIISVIFFIGAQDLNTPFLAEGEDELRYYRYAVDRFAAFSNVTWDLGNEHDFHRNGFWTDHMAMMIRDRLDPYGHLLGVHNKIYHKHWNDMQLIQDWDAGLNARFNEYRRKQHASGRVIPQVNEEYGYERLWERFPGHRGAETRRRCAWELAMAGCYQTAGEHAKTGCGVNEDTGGGWITGRGDETMTLFQGYRHMVEFFTSFEWWRLEPCNECVHSYQPARGEIAYYTNAGEPMPITDAWALAEAEGRYVVYLPAGGTACVKLGRGVYDIQRFNPRDGSWQEMGACEGGFWFSPALSDAEDWVFMLTRRGADQTGKME